MALTDDQVSVFLSRPLMARIATVDPQTMQPHVVPVWFLWDGREIWISGYRDLQDFKELEPNKKCAVVVDNSEESKEVRGILLEGEVVLVREPRELVQQMNTSIFSRYLDETAMRQPETLARISDPENVVYRLLPAEIYTF
jgi:hypothetical protein